MNRIKDDDSVLKGIEPGAHYIEQPIVVVHMIAGNLRFILSINELDETASDPRVFGILISDMIDNIAAAYRHQTGWDEDEIRRKIMKAVVDENRFKEEDKDRVQMRGATIFPKRN
jgi:hypothetical protein